MAAEELRLGLPVDLNPPPSLDGAHETLDRGAIASSGLLACNPTFI